MNYNKIADAVFKRAMEAFYMKSFDGDMRLANNINDMMR
jgi:hypothetical protein